MKIKSILSSIIAFAVVLSVAPFAMSGCNLSPNLPSTDGDGGNDKTSVSVNYTVSFDSDGGNAVANKTVASGSKIPIPASPEKPGYIFSGWYLGDELWVFSENTVEGGTTYLGQEENVYIHPTGNAIFFKTEEVAPEE